MRALLIGIGLVACGGPQLANRQPRTWADHMTSADRHEQSARHHERAAAEASASASEPAAYSCGDTVLNDQLTTGGERVTTWMPCWNMDEEAARRHLTAAERERTAARSDRTHATALANAELIHCKGIPERELTHSPLAHRTAIAEIIPHRESGRVRGARILFASVPGLTVDYMRRAIACHQARHAIVGGDIDDPTVVPGAEVVVTKRGNRVEVLVTLDSDADAAIALARARELLPQAALR